MNFTEKVILWFLSSLFLTYDSYKQEEFPEYGLYLFPLNHYSNPLYREGLNNGLTTEQESQCPPLITILSIRLLLDGWLLGLSNT